MNIQMLNNRIEQLMDQRDACKCDCPEGVFTR